MILSFPLFALLHVTLELEPDAMQGSRPRSSHRDHRSMRSLVAEVECCVESFLP